MALVPVFEELGMTGAGFAMQQSGEADHTCRSTARRPANAASADRTAQVLRHVADLFDGDQALDVEPAGLVAGEPVGVSTGDHGLQRQGVGGLHHGEVRPAGGDARVDNFDQQVGREVFGAHRPVVENHGLSHHVADSLSFDEGTWHAVAAAGEQVADSIEIGRIDKFGVAEDQVGDLLLIAVAQWRRDAHETGGYPTGSSISDTVGTVLSEQTTTRAEIAGAFEEFLNRGARERRWADWAALFTDDARYTEHCLGSSDGQSAISAWILDAMEPFPNMTFSVDWSAIDGDRVAFWLWNHLPDPNGEDVNYGFPNLSIITYAGDGRWSAEEDFYHPKSAGSVVAAWYEAGGTVDTPADPTIEPRPSHPPLPSPAPDRAVVEAVADALVSENWLDLIAWGADYHDHGRQPIQRWAEVPRRERYRVIDGARVVVVVDHEVPAGIVAHVNEAGRVTYIDHVYNPVVIADAG